MASMEQMKEFLDSVEETCKENGRIDSKEVRRLWEEITGDESIATGIGRMFCAMRIFSRCAEGRFVYYKLKDEKK